MTSARSITVAVNPPRAAFLDFPLGHTSGRPGRGDEQESIIRDTVALFETVTESGTIATLPYEWATPWKQDRDRLAANAGPREDFPQYQSEDDRRAAIALHGENAACTVCTTATGPHD